MRVIGTSSATPELLDALRCVGGELGVKVCWYTGGRFHFRVNPDVTIAVCPESAGRLVIETFANGRAGARTWTRVTDHRRLASLVCDARTDAWMTA